ncbi:hypothetical protein CLI64_25450 [Nostoc sp. CENA543]|nr:hypothetical protein CLI64_25450 [Nostoc sp. CENA543]
MFKTMQTIQALLAAKQAGKFGDFAILKSDLFGAKVAPQIAAKLQPLEGYHPPIDLEKLSQYPLGTFGREYAEYMQANHLQAIAVSPEFEDVAKRNVFALRYAVTHDIFHVLLGFDTTYAGEIGVLAFAAQQNYSNSLKISLQIAKWLYPLLAPQQKPMILANLKKGQDLGKSIDCLLSYRFEEYWQEPIDKLRKKLGL